MTRLSALCLISALLAGCGSVPKDRFYVLSVPDAPSASAASPAYTVAIGAVSVPELVDRAQMVVYQPDNRVEIVEHERWAEPLRAAIPAAIAGVLRSELPGARVAIYPQRAVVDADCSVNLDIQRFEARRGNSTLVEALWSVRCGKGRMQQGRSLVRENLQGDDSYSAVVSGYDRAIAQISKELAQAVRSAR